MNKINIMNKEIKLLNQYKIKTKCNKLLTKPLKERKDKIDRLSKQICTDEQFIKYEHDNAIKTINHMIPCMDIQFNKFIFINKNYDNTFANIKYE